MAVYHEIQAQRYELKFIITESARPSIRSFVASYLELDGNAGEDYVYPIHSLYLDSPELSSFHASMNGDRNRCKLRIRYYNDDVASPAFLETKRKINEVVHKQRCMVPRDEINDVLAGNFSRLKSSALANHMAFWQLMHQTNATPRAHVAYLREAWVSRQDNSVRVTMDREVRVAPCFDLRLTTAMEDHVTVFPDQIVLELKFTNRFPDWFRDVVETFGLVQCGAAKYAGGIALHGEHRFHTRPELQYV